MNTIRTKIVLSWLLFFAWVVVNYFRHFLIAWCLLGIALLLRNSRPKTPQLPQHARYFLSFGFIIFLALTFIAEYHPFPPSIIAASAILAAVIVWPLLFYGAYLDYKAYKAAGGAITITQRVIRLAVIVEAISCAGMIFQTEPYGIWDRLCLSVGWSPFAVSQGLTGFFVLLHYPFVFLAAHLFHNVGFEVYNGRLVLTFPLGLLIVLLQCTLWYFIFIGLMRLCERVKLSFRVNNR